MRWRGRRLNLQRMRRVRVPLQGSEPLGQWWLLDSDEATRRIDGLVARVRAAYPTARHVDFHVVETDTAGLQDSRLVWQVRR
jgi:hypothetical protein